VLLLAQLWTKPAAVPSTYVLLPTACMLQVPLGNNYRVPDMLQRSGGVWTPEAALYEAHTRVSPLVRSQAQQLS
jgi:hypothetical protein